MKNHYHQIANDLIKNDDVIAAKPEVKKKVK